MSALLLAEDKKREGKNMQSLQYTYEKNEKQRETEGIILHKPIETEDTIDYEQDDYEMER